MTSRSAVRYSALVLLALWIFFRLRLIPTWFSNDDVGMMMICSGVGFSHSPDPHVLFTNIVIGIVLSHLYESFPHQPWYGIYILGANLLALLSMSISLLIGRSKFLGLISVLILYASVGLRTLCILQFTSTACMVAIGGFALLLLWWEANDRADLRTPSKFWLLLAFVLLVFSSLIRFESFLLITLLSCSLFFFREGLSIHKTIHQKFRSARMPFLILSFAVSTGWLFQQVNNYEYSKVPGWSEYYVANRLHANFVDFSLGRNSNLNNSALLKNTAGWTPNDFKLIESFFFFDDRVFSVSKMRAVSSALWSQHFKPVSQAILEVLKILSDPILVPVCISIIVLLIAYRGSELRIHQAILFSLSLLLLMLILVIAFKLPQPVYFSIAIFLLFVLLFYFDRGLKFVFVGDSWKFKAGVALPTLIVTGLFGYSYQLCRVNSRICKENNLAFRQTINTLSSKKTGSLYVPWGDVMRYEYMLPLDDVYAYMSTIELLPLVFRASQPLAAQMMVKHGLTLKKFDEALLQHDVFLISAPRLNALLASYLKEHYGVDVQFRLTSYFPRVGMELYQCERSVASQ